MKLLPFALLFIVLYTILVCELLSGRVEHKVKYQACLRGVQVGVLTIGRHIKGNDWHVDGKPEDIAKDMQALCEEVTK